VVPPTPTAPVAPPTPAAPVTPNQPAYPESVNGLLTKYTATSNPLMQQASTHALEDMNKRGLLNSSMAESAGQQAALSTMLPAAQQEASTQTQIYGTNQVHQQALETQQYAAQISAQLATLGQGFNVQLKNLEASNQMTLSKNTAAGNLYGTTLTQIGAVLNNANLSAAQQTASTNALISNLQAGLEFFNGLHA